MFVFYLDDSYADCGPVVCLGGYYAPIDAWEAFEREAEPIFKGYRIDVLHGVDFYRRRGCFSDWNGAKKAAFVSDLYAVAQRHIPEGVCSSVRTAQFKKNLKLDRAFSRMSPLSICFNLTLMTTLNRSVLGDRLFSEGVSFVIESGHKNNASVERHFYELKSIPEMGECLGTLTFSGKRDSRAIQLADFLAFHGRRTVTSWDANNYRGGGIKDLTLRSMVDSVPCLFNRHHLDLKWMTREELVQVTSERRASNAAVLLIPGRHGK